MSDDEDVVIYVGSMNSSHVGLINNKAKNVADILETPEEDRRLKKTIFLCGAFVSVVSDHFMNLPTRLHLKLLIVPIIVLTLLHLKLQY